MFSTILIDDRGYEKKGGETLISLIMTIETEEDRDKVTEIFDCSYEEIGKILSIRPENAKMRLFRARKALNKKLKLVENYYNQ
jgi:hypothetical protein